MKVEAVLLGTAQDAGVPQVGCHCHRCDAARVDPARRHLAACLGLVDYTSQRYWLIDATPDFREQIDMLERHVPGTPTLAGILLTHAHLGHYTGLIQLGREAWNTQGTPVYATRRMASFLCDNAPWRGLIEAGNIEVRVLTAHEEVGLAPGLHVTPIPVPHRDEWSDTLAFLVRGAQARLFYCPDIDGWDQWGYELAHFLEEVDIALLDGTFYGPDELPGRDLRTIPHPFVVETLAHLEGASCKIYFTHLNHSNPLLQEGAERAALDALGVDVGQLGDRWKLS